MYKLWLKLHEILELCRLGLFELERLHHFGYFLFQMILLPKHQVLYIVSVENISLCYGSKSCIISKVF